jgi:hypothetical protein
MPHYDPINLTSLFPKKKIEIRKTLGYSCAADEGQSGEREVRRIEVVGRVRGGVGALVVVISETTDGQLKATLYAPHWG